MCPQGLQARVNMQLTIFFGRQPLFAIPNFQIEDSRKVFFPVVSPDADNVSRDKDQVGVIRRRGSFTLLEGMLRGVILGGNEVEELVGFSDTRIVCEDTASDRRIWERQQS